FVLRRSYDEARRLGETIETWSRGRPVVWPANTQTPLDAVVDALRRASPREPGAEHRGLGEPYAAQQLPPGMQAPPPLSRPASSAFHGHAASTPSQSVPAGEAPLPDWLRPMIEGGQSSYQPGSPAPVPRQPGPSSTNMGRNPWSLDPEENLPD